MCSSALQHILNLLLIGCCCLYYFLMYVLAHLGHHQLEGAVFHNKQ